MDDQEKSVSGEDKGLISELCQLRNLIMGKNVLTNTERNAAISILNRATFRLGQ